MTESRTVHDPFLGKDVQISNRLTDRLRGRYANGPTMPNGEPEFGWREFPTPPIQKEAADEIDRLNLQLAKAQSAQRDLDRYLPDLVKNAMLTQWNYICDETKCHPLDIEHGRGKYLTFEPKHWAQFAGDMVRQNVRDLLGPDKPHADDIGKT